MILSRHGGYDGKSKCQFKNIKRRKIEMAKNWSLKGVLEAVKTNAKEDIVDIGRRFPLTLITISKLQDVNGIEDLINAIPEHITARKIEKVLRDGVEVSDSIDDDDDDEIKEPVMNPPVVEAADESVEEPKKRGRKKKEADPEPVKEEKAEEKDDDLESKSEVELFKLCKSKGIKAVPKKDKKYYINLLNGENNSSDDEDEDWDI